MLKNYKMFYLQTHLGTCAFSWEHIILLILLISDSILRLLFLDKNLPFFNTLPAGTGKVNDKYFA